MATNADEPGAGLPVSQDEVADLAAAKAEAEDKPEAEESAQVANTETEEDAQASEGAQAPEAEDEAPAEPDATLTNDVPAEPEKDLEWYKKAYENSTTEALRLKGELDKAKPEAPVPSSEPPPVQPGAESLDPDRLYLEHLRTKDINTVWTKVIGEYPQLADPKGDTYKKFVSRANVMGKTILEEEKRYVEPSELYPMVISSLGLNKGDDQDKLAAALKDGAASPKVTSGKATPSKSKVTDAMIAVNQRIYPGKSASEIREELEPYVQ